MAASLVFRKIDFTDCRRMYDSDVPNKAMIIERALTPEFGKLLRDEVLDLDRNGIFTKAPPRDGVADQNMFTVNMGTWGMNRDRNPKVKLEELAACSAVAHAFAHQVYNALAEIRGFPKVDMMNTVSLHKYPAQGGLLSLHRDLTSAVDVSGLITVKGSRKLTLATSLEGDDMRTRILLERDLTLLPSNPVPKVYIPDVRPYHMIESLGEDVYSMIIRNRVDVSD